MSGTGSHRGLRWLPAAALGLAVLLAGCADAPDPDPGPAGRVYDSAERVEPLALGSSVPSASIRNVAGETLDLAGLVAERGALLVFYRGGW